MREGIILQLIGVSLFTPLVFGWLIEWMYKVVKSTIIFLFGYLKRNNETGQLISTAYLKTIEQLDSHVAIKEKPKALLWPWFINVFAIFMFLGFLSWFHINWLGWVPNWLKWASVLYGALLILDVLTAAIWDWGLFRIKRIRRRLEKVIRLSKQNVIQEPKKIGPKLILFSFLMFENPPANRVQKKLIINLVFYFVFPIFSSLISLQLTLLLIVSSVVNSKNTGKIITLLGWAFVVSGLISQLIAS